MRSFPWSRVKVLHPAQYDLLDNHPDDRQKNKLTNKRCPGCLAYAVMGMFHSVVANQRGGEGSGGEKKGGGV